MTAAAHGSPGIVARRGGDRARWHRRVLAAGLLFGLAIAAKQHAAAFAGLTLLVPALGANRVA